MNEKSYDYAPVDKRLKSDVTYGKVGRTMLEGLTYCIVSLMMKMHERYGFRMQMNEDQSKIASEKSNHEEYTYEVTKHLDVTRICDNI